MLSKKTSLELITCLRNVYPDAGPRLIFDNPYQLLVAVILSAQSTDKQVNEITPALFARYPGFEELAAANLDQLEQDISSVGLYQNKARFINECAKAILEIHRGTVPDTMDQLLGLPGIGRKSANVILSVAYGKPGLAVDTHVFRVAWRTGLAREKDPDRTELALKSKLPQGIWSESHHLLIFHGRAVCTARKAKCLECQVNHLCERHLDFPGNKKKSAY